MGQALSSCAACCSENDQGCKDETYQKAEESYQKAVPNEKNPQCKDISDGKLLRI